MEHINFDKKLISECESITIKNHEEMQSCIYHNSRGIFIGSSSNLGISTKKIDIIIEGTNKKNTINLLVNIDSDDTNQFNDFGIIEEVVDCFLKNNTICHITQMSKNVNNYSLDYCFKVRSEENKYLKIEIKLRDNAILKDKFKINIIQKIYLKYQVNFSQFLIDNNNKHIYFYIENYNSKVGFYIISPNSSPYNQLLKNVDYNEKVVVIQDSETNRYKLLEERLNKELELASLEVLSKRELNSFNDNIEGIKILCNDCIFVFENGSLLEETAKRRLEDIVKKHNQSIEKGRKLLMELESGEKELW